MGLDEQYIHSTQLWRSMIVGSSPLIRQLIELIATIAGRRTTVLITGETGSGKEMVARAIHAASPRAAKPLVALNCAAISKDLLEAELFGTVKGAFPGAGQDRIGHLSMAEGSTLLLDEIGDLALDLQAKLLRVLQEREYQRVGSSETVKMDVRVLAVTNVDLSARVKQGRFREDLYYRLHVVPIRVPSLRERISDLPELAAYFIQKIAAREALPEKKLGEPAVKHLMAYSWPGNIRELENALEMAMIFAGNRSQLDISDFSSLDQPKQDRIEMTGDHLVKLPDDGLDFESVIARIELNLLEQALQKTAGNKKLAADLLRLKRTTLNAKLKTLTDP